MVAADRGAVETRPGEHRVIPASLMAPVALAIRLGRRAGAVPAETRGYVNNRLIWVFADVATERTTPTLKRPPAIR